MPFCMELAWLPKLAVIDGSSLETCWGLNLQCKELVLWTKSKLVLSAGVRRGQTREDVPGKLAFAAGCPRSVQKQLLQRASHRSVRGHEVQTVAGMAQG